MASRLVATGDKPRLSSCDSLPKQRRRRGVLRERIGAPILSRPINPGRDRENPQVFT